MFNNQFTQVEYTWIPAGAGRPNTFTAQNVFKSPDTINPGFVAQGTGTISAIPTLDSNAVGLFQGTESVAGHVFFSASNATTHVVFRRNNGTYAVPTALANGNVIGSLQWQGRGASTFGTSPTAQIRGVTREIFTETARGSLLEFQVTPTGSITPSTILTLLTGTAVLNGSMQATSTGLTVAGIVGRSAGTISALPAGYGGSSLAGHFIAEESSAFPYTLFDATGNSQGHILAFRQSRGTYASRTATQNGDVLGQLNFAGHNGTALVDNKARIQAVASETYTAGANGTRLEFYTTTAGTNSSTLSLSMIGGFASFSGQVVGTDFQLSNSVGNTRTIFFRTSSSTRWTLTANANAESGSNAGSNFEITRWSDTQVSLGHIMQATRSSGDITFNAGGGTSTFTNDIIAPFVQVNRPAGNIRPILYRSSGVTRWAMQATATAESGSNTGSDWALDSHNDAGAYNFTALAISRSGGNATFYNLVTAPQLRVSLSNAPASATATGSAGQIRWDANYIYVCTATDTWKRVAIATW